ncbi:hypothetical protein WJX82_003348 [Trebouxia sp. C0006]
MGCRWPWQLERSSGWTLLFSLWTSVGIALGILQFPGSSPHLVWRERSSVPWSAWDALQWHMHFALAWACSF